MGRVLGVDLGERRIGLALSDALGITAGPLLTLERGGSPAADRAAIVAAARENEVERIVVGMPTSMSGQAGPAAKAAAAEIEALQAAAGPDLPVVAHDERLTTVTAQRALAGAKVKKGDRRGLVDQVAAAVMLQSWLDAQPGGTA
jgi:putative Holliday junction resolvase